MKETEAYFFFQVNNIIFLQRRTRRTTTTVMATGPPIRLSHAVMLTNSTIVRRGNKWFVTHPAFKNKDGLVAFMAGWCGHCQRLKPAYDRAAQTSMPSTPLGYVDCVAYPQLASAMGIAGYPTIKIVKANGEIGATYNGNRTYDGLMIHICHSGGSGTSSRGFCSRFK